VISNEIRGTMVDHVLNHGLSMREAGQRVQPNLSRFTVAAIIRTFRMENRYELYLPCVLKYCISIEYSVLTVFVFCRTEREPHRGGRTCTFTAEQETDIVKMVRENNTITLRQIQTRILADHATFRNIQTVSLSTLDRVLRRNAMRMKQVYRVLFDRNTDHIKELRQEFVLVSPIHSALTHACIVPVIQYCSFSTVSHCSPLC